MYFFMKLFWGRLSGREFCLIYRLYKNLCLTLFCATLTVAAYAPAQAAGFYLQESSVSGLGASYAGAATNIKNASTIWFNAAGLTQLEGTQVSGGFHLLLPSTNMDNRGSTFLGVPVTGGDGGNPYKPTPIPNIYASLPVTPDTTLGLGLNAPFGLSADFGPSWFGRYDSTKSMLLTQNLSAVVAHKVTETLSIGGGVDFQYARARLEQIITVGGSGTGTGILKGEDSSFGFNMGLQYKPRAGTMIGASYRSEISHRLKGRILTKGLALNNFDDAGYADLDLPDMLSFGVTQDIDTDKRLMANVTWYGWNAFDRLLPINTTTGTGLSSTGLPVAALAVTENYRNTISIALGGEYDINPEWTLRSGYQFDPTPTRHTYRDTRVPDGDRHFFSGGATYKISDNVSMDFGASFIYVTPENISVTRNVGAAEIEAGISGYVGILSAALKYKF